MPTIEDIYRDRKRVCDEAHEAYTKARQAYLLVWDRVVSANDAYNKSWDTYRSAVKAKEQAQRAYEQQTKEESEDDGSREAEG